MSWEIKECSGRCIRCNRDFTDGEFFWCRLSLEQNGPRREDYCTGCWDNSKKGYSSWKGRYKIQPEKVEGEPIEEPMSKQLLKKYLHSTDRLHQCLCYILAVLLERNKTFQPRPSMKGHIVYEDRDTGETYILTDPGLTLKELDGMEIGLQELLKQELH